jgi:hypothetical protein
MHITLLQQELTPKTLNLFPIHQKFQYALRFQKELDFGLHFG